MNLITLYGNLERAILSDQSIPKQHCDGCTAVCCCSYIPSVNQEEVNIIREYIREKALPLPEWKPDRCRFLDISNRCAIYPVRPFQCRVFFCDSNRVPLNISSEIATLLEQYRISNKDLEEAARNILNIKNEEF